MTAMPDLATERLVVRPFAEHDLPEALTVLGVVPSDAAGVERTRRFLRWAELNHVVLADLHQPPYGDRAIVLRETGRVVGAVGFVPSLAPFRQLPSFGPDGAASPTRLLTPEIGLYWAVAPAERRRGIATEAATALVRFAFEHLRVLRLVATTEHENHASIGVMRRLGMRIERNPHADPEWLQVVGVLDNPLETAS